MNAREPKAFRRCALWVAALAVWSLLALPGCDMGREFRAAALPQVSEGVTQVVNGLLDGLLKAHVFPGSLT